MIPSVIRERILELQEYHCDPPTFDEVVELLGEDPEELEQALQEMDRNGYLFFDGEVIEVYT